MTASALSIAPIVPASLAESTTRIAWMAGSKAAGMVPAGSMVLAQEVLKAMTGFQLKWTASAVLALGVAASGVGVLARPQEGQGGSTSAVDPAASKESGRSSFESNSLKRARSLAAGSFPADHWTRSEDVKFFFHDAEHRSSVYGRRYHLTEDGKQIRVSPFAMITVSEDEKHRTVSTSDDANLELNRPFSPVKPGEVIRIRHVRMSGHVRIRGDEGLELSADEFELDLKDDPTSRPVGPKPDQTEGSAKISTPDPVPGRVGPPRTDGRNQTSNQPEENQARLAQLRDDHKALMKRLEKAKRITRNSEDPSIVLARNEIATIEAEIVRLELGSPDVSKALAEKGVQGPRGNSDPKPPTNSGIEAGPAVEFAKVAMPAYVVEPPDILVVELHQALPGRPITGERLVRPDGKISLGYYGDVYVAGLTEAEIKAKLALHLRSYLDVEKPDPVTGKNVGAGLDARVFVDVVSYNSKAYYVQGEVARPGRFPITGNETVLDAVNYAGGLVGEKAKVNVRLIRPRPAAVANGTKGPTGGEMTLNVDLAAIVDRGDAKTNYQLFPGDRLVAYRDPAVPPGPTPSNDVEARLQEVERKLDEVLKVIDRLPKP